VSAKSDSVSDKALEGTVVHGFEIAPIKGLTTI